MFSVENSIINNYNFYEQYNYDHHESWELCIFFLQRMNRCEKLTLLVFTLRIEFVKFNFAKISSTSLRLLAVPPNEHDTKTPFKLNFLVTLISLHLTKSQVYWVRVCDIILVYVWRECFWETRKMLFVRFFFSHIKINIRDTFTLFLSPLIRCRKFFDGVTFHRISRLVDPFVKVHILIIKLDRFLLAQIYFVIIVVPFFVAIFNIKITVLLLVVTTVLCVVFFHLRIIFLMLTSERVCVYALFAKREVFERWCLPARNEKCSKKH